MGTEKKARIGVLISGGGSNLQAILDASKNDRIPAQVACVISNKADAFGLERAKKAGVDSIFIDPKTFPTREAFYEQIISEFGRRSVNLVCLAGYLLRLEPNIIQEFEGRILNIHPALLPKFGGKGFYGHFVHEAVIKSGEKESGCTVHLVDEEFDHGTILKQRKVPVLPGDTPETLAKRVLEQEHRLFPEALREFIDGHLVL